MLVENDLRVRRGRDLGVCIAVYLEIEMSPHDNSMMVDLKEQDLTEKVTLP